MSSASAPELSFSSGWNSDMNAVLLLLPAHPYCRMTSAGRSSRCSEVSCSAVDASMTGASVLSRETMSTNGQKNCAAP